MISILINSYKEPKTISRAIISFLNQKISEEYELYVCAPDEETLAAARKFKNYKQLKLFKDAGKGKSSAINQILNKLKGKIVILTDGDVYVSEDSVRYLLEKFKDPKVGAVSARPISVNSKNNIYGFWSHMLVNAAHKLRLKKYQDNKFLECSGYLWAFRKIINSFPTDVAEDSIVPAILWKKGYKVAYEPRARVYVKYPDNLKDILEQRRRSVQSHEKLSLYIKNLPKMKSLKNEVLYAYSLFSSINSLKQFLWLLSLFPLRAYVWLVAYYYKARKNYYSDKWKRVESTK